MRGAADRVGIFFSSADDARKPGRTCIPIFSLSRRRARIRSSIIALVLLCGAGNSMADVTSDRNRLLPVIHDTCKKHLRSDRILLGFLTESRASMEELCNCVGSSFVGGLSNAEIAEFWQRGLSESMGLRLLNAEQTCMTNAIRRRR
jgi:hypothetical protein